jgi:hypothetical protein
LVEFVTLGFVRPRPRDLGELRSPAATWQRLIDLVNLVCSLRYALAGKKGVFLVRITPEVISVLDYRKGFGHTDPHQTLIKL